MSSFAKYKTLRSYPSLDIFNVSKFGSFLSLLSKVSIYNLTGKKEKMARGVGGRFFEGGD